jgi:hypothetical protein
MAYGSVNRLRFQKLANRYRTRIPGIYGVRPWKVYFRTTSSSGTHTGDGTLTTTEVEVLENGWPPKVREDTSDLVMRSDDAVDVAVFEIGPMTQVVGTPWATIDGDTVLDGEQYQIRLEHVETGESILTRIEHVQKDRGLHTTIRCSVVRPG